MLCTNCASPAFCKIIACFHTPLIKKKKKIKENLFRKSFIMNYLVRSVGLCKQADLFCIGVTSRMGCKMFSSAEILDMEHGSGKSAHTESYAPCLPPRHHQVPTDGARWHCLLAREGWTTWKSLHKKVQPISFLLFGSLLPAGVAAWHWNPDKASRRGPLSHHLPAQARRQIHASWHGDGKDLTRELVFEESGAA